MGIATVKKIGIEMNTNGIMTMNESSYYVLCKNDFEQSFCSWQFLPLRCITNNECNKAIFNQNQCQQSVLCFSKCPINFSDCETSISLYFYSFFGIFSQKAEVNPILWSMEFLLFESHSDRLLKNHKTIIL